MRAYSHAKHLKVNIFEHRFDYSIARFRTRKSYAELQTYVRRVTLIRVLTRVH